ncbi:MAG: Fic family protein [Verrucomicrobiaceae bacterium]
MPSPYAPPFTLTSRVLHLAMEISQEIGRLSAQGETAHALALRRANRLKSIHASLAIENNTLSLEQVTAVIAGKRVLAPPQEIQEVRNAYAAYEAMEGWKPWSEKHLLTAHRLLMKDLVDSAGRYRTGGVGIAQGTRIVHLAPSAERVPGLMKDLLRWLKDTDAHPLISSCVFHYELEFIHPFADGNGRMGRLWQTLILSQWSSPLANLPVETVIRARQAEYYQALAASDKQGNSTIFIEFLLAILLQVLRDATDQVSDQVKALLECLGSNSLSAVECMRLLGLVHRPTFRKNYLQPAINAGLIGRMRPDAPKSRLQKYRCKGFGS